MYIYIYIYASLSLYIYIHVCRYGGTSIMQAKVTDRKCTWHALLRASAIEQIFYRPSSWQNARTQMSQVVVCVPS